VPPRERQYRWEWRLPASPEALWPLVADTDRFNRDTGVPPVEPVADGRPAAPQERHLRLRRFGVVVEWVEEPFEWLYPRRFGVRRRYLRGPLAEMRVAAELEPDGGAGTRLTYRVWATPSGRRWTPGVALQLGLISRRRAGAAFTRYAALAAAGRAEPPPPAAGRPQLAPGGAERLRRAAEALAATAAPELVGRLAALLADADDAELDRLRPYALADRWGAPRRDVLELCLRATREGLLDLRWEVLCPLCRGSERPLESLADVTSRVHCSSCNIDFTATFDRSVELTFRPNAAVREVDAPVFCVGGPQLTPHIVAQQALAAGARADLPLRLEPGVHRLRAVGAPGAWVARAESGGAAAASVRLAPSGWPDGEPSLAPDCTLSVANDTPEERLVVLERTAWSDQAATAAHVTALQLFRDLFASEALRPGEPISVGSLTVLFTDLRGSTRYYREVGDAPAFGRVIEHIDLLRAAVAEQDGAVVKTMGDAVMAVFPRPLAAVRAAAAAQRRLAEVAWPLVLKAGAHHGPCIAIGQNGRLDYFGSTVNAAARLVGLSAGGDLVVSAAVGDDPEVRAAAAAGELVREPFEAELRGFEGETFPLFRVREGGP
jgi:class 3 adenylate cyclase